MKAEALCPATGKVCYTKAAAKAAAGHYRRTGVLNSDKRMNAYRCPDAHEHHPNAGLFHIGHRPGKRRYRGVL